MNRKQKGGIILSSLAAIAIAGSLIAGSTYALFTSESKANIAITSGKVNVSASISNFEAHTPMLISLDGSIKDDAELATKVEDKEDEYIFGNGGTAKLIGQELKLDKMTPGDYVNFDITIANNSNVDIKYCVKVTSEGDSELLKQLSVEFPGYSVNGSVIWKTLAYVEGGASIAGIEGCKVSLPTTADNDCQDKSCTLTFTVEAVQGNAETEDVYYVSNATELKDCTTKTGKNKFVLSNDLKISTPVSFTKGDNVLDLNGHKIDASSCYGAIVSKSGGVLNVKNGTVNAYGLCFSSEDIGNLTLENVTASSKETCILVAGDSKLTINSGTYSATDNMVVGTNGSSPGFSNNTIIINGGTFNASIEAEGYIAVGVCFANTGTLLVNDGIFNVTGGVGIIGRNGHTTVKEGVTFNMVEKEGLTEGKVGDDSVKVPTGKEIVQDFKAKYYSSEDAFSVTSEKEGVEVYQLKD